MKKIMFNDLYSLTLAVLKKLKKKTRRSLPQNEGERINAFQQEYYEASLDWLEGKDLLEAYYLVNHKERLPFKVGDIVAIAQNYEAAGYEPGRNIHNSKTGYDERADSLAGWSNKMFVSADLMPHHIKITDIQIELLQDISNEDCLAEGIYPCKGTLKGLYTYDNAPTYYETPRKAFASLIDKISGKGTWESNPYVLVYSFEFVN